MKLKVGDRVTENGRQGTIVAFHTKGTVDVHFDDMEHEIRRQMHQVKPLRQNGKVTPISLLVSANQNLLNTLNANTPTPYNRDISIYILSGTQGIVEPSKLNGFHKKIVGDRKRFYKKTEVKAEKMARLIGKQWDSGVVLLAGNSHCKSALEQAGFEVILIEDLPDFPHKNVRGGIGRKAKALKWLLIEYLPSQRR